MFNSPISYSTICILIFVWEFFILNYQEHLKFVDNTNFVKTEIK